jgi:hypothetical protein
MEHQIIWHWKLSYGRQNKMTLMLKAIELVLVAIYFQNKKNEDFIVVNFLIEIYISQTIYFWNQETKPIEWFLRPEVPFFRNWTWKMSSATIYFQNQENINYYIVQFHIRSDFFFIGMEM